MLTDDKDEAMMQAVLKMSAQEQEHFKKMIRFVASCYIDKNNFSGLLIVRESGDTVLISINANEMDAAEMIGDVAQFINKVVTHDAPPREQFN